MTARNYTILSGSSTPIQEFGLPRDVFIVNEDLNNTVYLDTNRGTAYTSGMPLPPQSTKRWIAGDPCFAITAPGLTATVNVSDNAGELNNPSAVATQILNQGLATQIASAINLQGVPAIDRMTLLADVTINQDGASHNIPVAGVFDVSSYQTIIYTYTVSDPSALAVPVDYSLTGFYWMDTLGNVLDYTFLHTFGDNFNTASFSFTSGRLQVKAPSLAILISIPNRAGGTGTLRIFGSYRVSATDSFYTNSGFYTNTAANTSSYGLDRYVSVTSPNLASLASVTPWIPVRSGLCTALFTYNATVPANGLDFLVQDFDGVPIAGVRTAGGGAASYTTMQQFYMPNRPIQCFLRNRGPAALTSAMQAQFTWQAQ